MKTFSGKIGIVILIVTAFVSIDAHAQSTVGFACITGAIGNYYNGGSGPNVGIDFTIGNAAGGKLDATDNPVINVPAGFASAFSLDADVAVGFRIRIYDALNATGTQLATQDYFSVPGTFFITFSGVAMSVKIERFSNPTGGYDDLTFGSATPGNLVQEASGVIYVTGNSITIADGDITPTVSDNTDFGEVSVCSGAVLKEFTIHNTGPGEVVGCEFEYEAPNTNFFTPLVTQIPPIPVGGSHIFTIGFDPTGLGLLHTTVSIFTSDCDNPRYQFDIEGTGIDPEINVQGGLPLIVIVDGDGSPSVTDDTDFGNVVLGSDATHTFIIQNTGTSALAIGGASVVGVNTEFIITTAPASSVTPLGGTYFDVLFTPIAVGNISATIHIANDDCNEDDYNFSVKGKGVCSTVCQNGGLVNTSCGCDCPSGYTGANCEIAMLRPPVVATKN
jgi:hypothetical protein